MNGWITNSGKNWVFADYGVAEEQCNIFGEIEFC